MKTISRRLLLLGVACLLSSGSMALPLAAAEISTLAAHPQTALDQQVAALLLNAGFTGRIESTLERRLGRPVDRNLVKLGRAIFFDSLAGLHDDNSCAGCHSPSNGFGDTQSMAIGVDNNGRVGPRRTGPRYQRRSPMVANSAFYLKLMWNGRFAALSGNPFDNSQGFSFPAPEGITKFPPNDPEIPNLLTAQGHIPPTELVEMAGLTGTAGTISSRFDPFDDGQGSPVPAPDGSGFRNDPIRDVVLARFNASSAYRTRFAEIFPEVASGADIRFSMIAKALAEFQISLTFADAPIDQFARGHRNAMNDSEKRGAVLFFGSAGCVSCHAVGGASNEMFSDFENHVLGVPQIAPVFGVGSGDVVFDGPDENEDFGQEQISGNPLDRYRFRTSPLRNIALQPAFFHNGSFTRLKDAILHHLNVVRSARSYNPVKAGIDADLTMRQGPTQPVLDRLDPLVAQPIHLSQRELRDLVAFVGGGLLDQRARPEQLCRQIPTRLPRGRPLAKFEDCL